MSGFTIPNTPDAFNQNQAEPDSVDFQILGKQANGVVSGMAVTTSGAESVNVSSGEVLINGSYYPFAGITGKALTPYSTSNFFDLVVARVSGVTVSIEILQGNSGTNPRFPSTVNHTTDVVIAAVWRDGSTVVANAIIDKRVFVRSNAVRMLSDTVSENRGSTGDLYVNTAWTASATSTSSPLSVKVGSSWYNLAYWPANASITTTGNITATTFIGNLTGNVTGNVTGNASSATYASSATLANTANLATDALSSEKLFKSGQQIVFNGANWWVTSGLEVAGVAYFSSEIYSFGMGTTTAAANMRYLSSGRIAYNTSLRKYKEDIKNFDDAIEIINSLTPRTFKAKKTSDDGPVEEYERTNSVYHGFVVEEILEVAPYLVEFGMDQNKELVPQMWKTNDVISILTRAVQQLDARVKELENAAG